MICGFLFFSSFIMVTEDLIKAGKYQSIKIEGNPEDVGLVFYGKRFEPSENIFLVLANGTSNDYLFIIGEKSPIASYSVGQVDGDYLLRCDFDPPKECSTQPIHKRYKVTVQKDINGLLTLEITNDSHELTGPIKIYLKYVSNSQQLAF